jgi:hypothetical protein
MSGLRSWFAAGALALALGCATPRAAGPQLLVQRASFDLGCHPASLSIHAFDARTRAVVGCGQRATYVEDCQAPGRPCTWVADVGPTALAPAAVAAPAAPPVAAPPASAWSAAAAAPPTAAPPPPERTVPVQGFRNEEDYGF